MHIEQMHFENACCPKMHIDNAYFLRAVFAAFQKCKMDSGRPTFLICTVSPKALRAIWTSLNQFGKRF